MGFYTGRTGALYISESPGYYSGDVVNWDVYGPPGSNQFQVLKLRDWSLETTLELLETTTADTAVKAYTPGMASATGSATVLYYRREGTTSTEPGQQFDVLLKKIMKTTQGGVQQGDRVLMGLRTGTTLAGSDNKDDISFSAWITNASLQVSTGELSSVAIQFTVDGPFLEVPQE
jgi:hypothetical protein